MPEIINEALLAIFRSRPCEWIDLEGKVCGRLPPNEPDHILGRGMGGGGRYDVKWNLVSLCREHHQARHDGVFYPFTRELLIHLVAIREHKTEDDVREALWALRKGTYR